MWRFEPWTSRTHGFPVNPKKICCHTGFIAGINQSDIGHLKSTVIFLGEPLLQEELEDSEVMNNMMQIIKGKMKASM